MATDREAAIYAMPSSTEAERAAQVEALIELAQDPTDEYDSHHGHDRSPDAAAFAAENPGVPWEIASLPPAAAS
ncbi:MAG: hypothetical protein AB7T06_24775 [Kofleriaceae bacterium]